MTNHIRERSRELLRAELAAAAFDYFVERGFDAVTVDEVAHGIGISRATFFRYFGSKEDAVVAAVYSPEYDFPRVLAEQDLGPAVPAWARLRSMFAPSIAEVAARPEALRSRIRLIDSTPSLRSRLNERRMEQRVGVAEQLVSDSLDLRTARAYVACAFSLLDLAWSEWVADPRVSLPEVLDELFAAMTPR